MNERIQELAEQSGCYQPHGLPTDWDNNDYVVSPDHMKKFAELIVQECIKIAVLQEQDMNEVELNSIDEEYYCAYNTGVFAVIESIEEYFGVKE